MDSLYLHDMEGFEVGGTTNHEKKMQWIQLKAEQGKTRN